MKPALRIIPRLDIKGPNLVKGVHLEGLRVLGRPEDFAEFYYKQGADELIYQDVVASLYGRNSLYDMISRTARKIFIPLTVGGGIKCVDDIYRILQAGADKVMINTSAVANPNIISESANLFGKSTIVVGIEAIHKNNDEYFISTDSGRNTVKKRVVEWAKEAEDMGAGEISLTSVDAEGCGKGFDLNLIEQVLDVVSIPVVAHGGPGKNQHVLDLVNKLPVSGVAISSLFHYDCIKNKIFSNNYEGEGNVDFLCSNRILTNIESSSIGELRAFLLSKNIYCREYEK